MTLMEFVEQLDSETKIVVTYYGCIEYRGTVGGISIDYLKNRKLIYGSVVMLDGELCIQVNRVYPNRHIDVAIKIREDLSKEDRLFIEQELERLMNKHEIERTGDFYYKIQNKAFDDFHPVISFYLEIKSKKEWRKYIKGLGYVSHMEGTHRYDVWD